MKKKNYFTSINLNSFAPSSKKLCKLMILYSLFLRRRLAFKKLDKYLKINFENKLILSLILEIQLNENKNMLKCNV